MNTRPTYNRKWAGWLLILALFAMALPSQAAWLCPTGTLCAADCPMLRGGTLPANGAVLSAGRKEASLTAHCSHCPAAAASSSTMRGGWGASQTLRAPIKCVLRARTQPAATLAGASVILLPLLALPPPPITRHAVALEELSPVLHSLPVFLLPPCPARPHPGRAPPFRLA